MSKGLSISEGMYNLAIGTPDLNPPTEIFELIDNFKNNPKFNYQPTKGSTKALANVKSLIDPDNNSIDPNKNILLIPGAKYGIYMSLKTICNIGDNVLLIEPYWLSYPDICKSLNLNFHSWTINHQKEDYLLEDFKELLNKHSFKVIIINNPINPTGYIFKESFLKQIIQHCSENNIWIILDEVYKDLCFDPNIRLHENLFEPNLIRVGSFSKSLSIPGFRIGYVIGSEDFISHFSLFHQHIITSISSVSNDIISNISEKSYRRFVLESAEIYKERYLKVKEILDSKGLPVCKSECSFYVLVNMSSKFNNGEEACDFYEKKNILLTPGVHYGKNYASHVRICLTKSTETLVKIIEML
jgi:aspartate aminotransferase